MYKIKKLDNGLRVLFFPVEHAKSVAMYVTAKVGSRYEDQKNNGIAHFLEHLMFKGTKVRPSTEIISKELDSIGASYNAFTAKDRTAYHISAHKKHLAKINDILADMYQNSLLDKKEMEQEKGVIVEEIHMYDDNPLMKIEDLAEDLLFGDNPLGWDIAGSEENIKKMTIEDINKFYNNYYIPANTFVVVTGDFDEVEAEKLIQEKWGKFSSDKIKTEFLEVKETVKGPVFKLEEKTTKQYQLALSFPGVSYEDQDAVAMKLLGIILGGNMSSRLFIKIRERQGLCYLIRAYDNNYEDNGAFIVQAGLDKARIKPAISSILNELKLLRDAGVQDKELKKAKNYLEGRLALRTETSTQLGAWFSNQVTFFKDIKDPVTYLELMKQVSKDDIQRLAKKIFQNENIHLALIGKLNGGKKEIEGLLKFD